MSSLVQGPTRIRTPIYPRAHRSLCWVSLLGVCIGQLAGGCLDSAGAVSWVTPEIAITTHDFAGVAVPPHRLPQWPKLKLAGALSPPPDAMALLPGTLSAALLTDLEHPPLNRDRASQQVPLRSVKDGAFTWLIPRHPLERGERYVLVLPASATARASLFDLVPVVVELWVDTAPSAGARLLASAPADGQGSVPPAVDHMLVAFDGPLSDCSGFRLAGHDIRVSTAPSEQAAALRLAGSAVPCEELDDRAMACCRLNVAGVLRPGHGYALDSGSARDLHGAPVIGAALSFSTLSSTRESPRRLLDPQPCGAGETALTAGLCALSADHHIRLRLFTAAPVQVLLDLGGRRVNRLSGVETVELEFPNLQPNRVYLVTLRLSDLSGVRHTWRTEVATTPPLPTLDITEVYSDPVGPEPQQEYVELHNFGANPLDVEGCSLGAEPADGVTLPALVLPPDARLLLVGPGYDPTAPGDPVPAPGGLRAVLPRPLGTNGLSNRGEVLRLWGRFGHLLSESPAKQVATGRCLQRRPQPRPRTTLQGTFAEGPCTPGR